MDLFKGRLGGVRSKCDGVEAEMVEVRVRNDVNH